MTRLQQDGDKVEGLDLKTGQDIRHGRLPWLNHKVVVHLAAISGIKDCERDPVTCYTTNIAATARLANAAHGNGARFIFASSAAAANPVGLYAISKATGELFCKPPYTILRLGNVYGPGSIDKSSVVASFCRSALTKGVITVHGDGKQTRDFVHINAVLAAILQITPCTWAVRSGTQTPIIDVARMIAEMTGATVEYDRTVDVGAPPMDKSPILELTHPLLEDGIRETVQYFREALK